MPSDLTSNVMVITGASSGIGAATAIAAAEAGMDLVLNARRARELEAVAEQARERGAGAELVVGDVTGKNLSARLLDTAQERFGRFDVVFSNAGYGLQTTVHETADEQWRRIFEVNFFASLDLLREAARRLLAGGRRGHLLMCSSCLAKFTLPYYSAYSATKAAQNHVCRAMAAKFPGKYVIYGDDRSFFTRKLEAVLRHKRLGYESRPRRLGRSQIEVRAGTHSARA